MIFKSIVLLKLSWAPPWKILLKKTWWTNFTIWKRFRPEYSLKNIPFPSKHQFILSLTDKIVNSFRECNRNPKELQLEQRKREIQMKSQKTPPSNKTLDIFEEELFKVIRKINFKKWKKKFQTKIEKDFKEIKNLKRSRLEPTTLGTYIKLALQNTIEYFKIRSRTLMK